MVMSNNEIIDTGDLSDDEYVRSHMAATTEPTENKVEFHVQMKSWTLQDMEALIVEAAARQLIGKSGDNKLAREIEARAMALTTEAIDRRLSSATSDIINQPLTPAFGDKKPVTMAEFLQLYTREYLTAPVDRHTGKPDPNGYGRMPRIEYLVAQYMDVKFKNEIEKATHAAVVEIKNAISARHKQMLADETKRIREYLAKAVSP